MKLCSNSMRKLSISTCLISIILSMPAWAGFIEPTPVEDPTFGGTIYSLKCTTHSISNVYYYSESESLKIEAEPFYRSDVNPFVINIEAQTFTLIGSPNFPLPEPKTQSVEFSATRFGYEKTLRVKFDNRKTSLVIKITGSPDGTFTATSAFSFPGGPSKIGLYYVVHYGSCFQE